MKNDGDKKILVLGAGLVAKPLVEHLLKTNNFEVTVADIFIDKAKKLVGSHPKGKAKTVDIDNTHALKEIVKDCDLVVSLLPATKHLDAAKIALEYGKHFFTTSYVKPQMKALDSSVRGKNLLFMNELGLDPRIDHMSAMRVFDKAKEKNGKILSFKSYCGGLPAPDSNDNPWGYKFSWSPKGVLLAAKNSFKYMKDGKIIEKPGEELFTDNHLVTFPELGGFEAYPNRDSMGYIDLYKINDVKTMYRGTLRNKGWSEVWKHMHKTGLLDETTRSDFKGATHAQFLSMCLGSDTETTVKKDLSEKLKIKDSHPLVRWFDWLGLFSNEKISLEKGSAIDVLTEIMLKKMSYKDGERDMVILHHDFIIKYPKYKEHVTSTMIDYGIPNGDSSMSRTVGLPCAIGVKSFLDGKFKKTGVLIPTDKDVYSPILEELERLNIKFKEKID